MTNLAQSESQSALGSVCPKNTSSHRRRTLNVLFVHCDTEAIDCCLEELEKGQFTVTSDVVSDLAQFADRLHTQSYDVIVALYPRPEYRGSQTWQDFGQALGEVPVIFLTTRLASGSDRGAERVRRAGVCGTRAHRSVAHGRPEGTKRKETAGGTGRGPEGLAAFAIAVPGVGGQPHLWSIPLSMHEGNCWT